MRAQLKRELRAARPSLRIVSPVSFWFILLMGVFNLFVGISMMMVFDQITDPTLSILTYIVPAWLWGILFITLGIIKLASIAKNVWKWTRNTLLMGVGLKSGWAIALALRTFEVHDNVFLTVCWITIAITQIIVFVHFLPPQEMRLFSGKRMKAND